jgi:hypothetical protein
MIGKQGAGAGQAIRPVQPDFRRGETWHAVALAERAGNVPAFATVTARPCAAIDSAARLWVTKASRQGRLAASRRFIAHLRKRQPGGCGATASGARSSRRCDGRLFNPLSVAVMLAH